MKFLVKAFDISLIFGNNSLKIDITVVETTLFQKFRQFDKRHKTLHDRKRFEIEKTVGQHSDIINSTAVGMRSNLLRSDTLGQIILLFYFNSYFGWRIIFKIFFLISFVKNDSIKCWFWLKVNTQSEQST